jgi:uncharacterized protein YeaO (DUF488 family)
MQVRIKRIYDEAEGEDGYRILVDRLWPRGVSKDKAKVALWLKEVAPSEELRRWFAHDPEKWLEFKARYFSELASKREWVEAILSKAQEGTVTLLYGAKDVRFNNAVALKDYLETIKGD